MIQDQHHLNTGQRVIEIIEESPYAAEKAADILRRKPSVAAVDQVRERYGERTAELYEFLGTVITDQGLYTELSISDDVVEAAANDDTQREVITELSRGSNKIGGGFSEGLSSLKKEVSLSNRANELRHVAAAAIRRSGAAGEIPQIHQNKAS